MPLVLDDTLNMELLQAASAALLKRQESVMSFESQSQSNSRECILDDGYTRNAPSSNTKSMAIRPLQPQGPYLSTDNHGIIRVKNQLVTLEQPQQQPQAAMDKCVLIGDGFIKKSSVNTTEQGLVETLETSTSTVYSLPRSLLKEKSQTESETAGPGWFNMPAPEVTNEIKRDLHILKSRGVLDPKRHYKKDNSKGLPKFFQFGTIITEAADRYSSVANIPKKHKANTIVEELLADSEKKAYFKKKFTQLQEKKQAIAEQSFRKTKGKLSKRRK